MKFTEIKASNFKSYNNLKIRLNDFNVIIGANGSGKTNFVSIFKLIRDIAQYNLEDAIALQGGFRFFYNNLISSKKPTEIGFSIKNTKPIAIYSKESKDKEIKCFFRKLDYFFRIKIEGYSFKIIEDKMLVFFDYNERKTEPKNKFQKIGEGYIELVNKEGKVRFKKFSNDIPEFDSLKLYTNEFQTLMTYNSLLLENPYIYPKLLMVLQRFLRKIPIFDFESELIGKGSDVVSKSDLDDDGKNISVVLKRITEHEHQRNSLVNMMSLLLPYVKNIETRITLEDTISFFVEESYSDMMMPSSVLSRGTRYILALVVTLFFEDRNILIYEDLDRSLHPSLILDMMKILKEASKDKQIILTTHNPLVLKKIELRDIVALKRDHDGYSVAERLSKNQMVKEFLKSEIGLDELFIDNLLE